MTTKRWVVLAVAELMGAGVAHADEFYPDSYVPPPEPSGEHGYAWTEPRMQSMIGIGVMIGGGVSGFTDGGMRDVTTDVGGLWDGRVSIGTHIPLCLDVSYLGTAMSLNTPFHLANGTLIGTTVEGALRFNILPHNDWDPYVFAGVGWQHYDARNELFATSDSGVGQSDNLAEFPVGAGVAYRDISGIMADVRGTIRAASDSSLVRETNGSFASLHTWEASAGIGYEF